VVKLDFSCLKIEIVEKRASVLSKITNFTTVKA